MAFEIVDFNGTERCREPFLTPYGTLNWQNQGLPCKGERSVGVPPITTSFLHNISPPSAWFDCWSSPKFPPFGSDFSVVFRPTWKHQNTRNVPSRKITIDCTFQNDAKMHKRLEQTRWVTTEKVGTETKREKCLERAEESRNSFIKHHSSPFRLHIRFSGPYILLACSSKINKLHHFWISTDQMNSSTVWICRFFFFFLLEIFCEI